MEDTELGLSLFGRAPRQETGLLRQPLGLAWPQVPLKAVKKLFWAIPGALSSASLKSPILGFILGHTHTNQVIQAGAQSSLSSPLALLLSGLSFLLASDICQGSYHTFPEKDLTSNPRCWGWAGGWVKPGSHFVSLPILPHSTPPPSPLAGFHAH